MISVPSNAFGFCGSTSVGTPASFNSAARSSAYSVGYVVRYSVPSVSSPVTDCSPSWITASATRPRSTSVSNWVRPSWLPAGPRPMKEMTRRKTSVPTTIQSVGVRAIFLSGGSGCWLSVRSLWGKSRQGPASARSGPFGRW